MRRTLIAAVGVSLLVLTGCGGGASSTPFSSVASSSPASVSTSASLSSSTSVAPYLPYEYFLAFQAALNGYLRDDDQKAVGSQVKDYLETASDAAPTPSGSGYLAAGETRVRNGASAPGSAAFTASEEMLGFNPIRGKTGSDDTLLFTAPQAASAYLKDDVFYYSFPSPAGDEFYAYAALSAIGGFAANGYDASGYVLPRQGYSRLNADTVASIDGLFPLTDLAAPFGSLALSLLSAAYRDKAQNFLFGRSATALTMRYSTVDGNDLAALASEILVTLESQSSTTSSAPNSSLTTLITLLTYGHAYAASADIQQFQLDFTFSATGDLLEGKSQIAMTWEKETVKAALAADGLDATRYPTALERFGDWHYAAGRAAALTLPDFSSYREVIPPPLLSSSASASA